jgi:hypothetical protein
MLGSRQRAGRLARKARANALGEQQFSLGAEMDAVEVERPLDPREDVRGILEGDSGPAQLLALATGAAVGLQRWKIGSAASGSESTRQFTAVT